MAKIINNNKGFKVICMSNEEAIALDFGTFLNACICIECDKLIWDEIYYIAVLNDVMCKTCYEKWYKTATRYKDDAEYENRYFNYYSKLLGL